LADVHDLLRKIAELGGIEPFSFLESIVSPTRKSGTIDTNNPMIRDLLAFMLANKNEANDNRVKQILWDARAATLRSTFLEAPLKSQRLKALDEIGRTLLHE
jgi:hypothetical protein